MAKLPVQPVPIDVRAAGAALDAAREKAFSEWDDSLSDTENTRIIDEKLRSYRYAHSAAMAKYDSNWNLK